MWDKNWIHAETTSLDLMSCQSSLPCLPARDQGLQLHLGQTSWGSTVLAGDQHENGYDLACLLW